LESLVKNGGKVAALRGDMTFFDRFVEPLVVLVAVVIFWIVSL
jgi:hypothetical protein